MSADGSADLLVVGIEDGFEVNAMALEGARADESGTHITHTDKHGGALRLLVDVTVEGGEYVRDGVTDVGLSDHTEAGHILSDERAVDVQFATARIGRDISLSILLRGVEYFAIAGETPSESTRKLANWVGGCGARDGRLECLVHHSASIFAVACSPHHETASVGTILLWTGRSSISDRRAS